MRMPQGALPADVEVLSEADLAAEGLVTFAAPRQHEGDRAHRRSEEARR